jgi:hypothetical protein
VKLYLNFKSHGNFLEDFYAKIFSIGDLWIYMLKTIL